MTPIKLLSVWGYRLRHEWTYRSLNVSFTVSRINPGLPANGAGLGSLDSPATRWWGGGFRLHNLGRSPSDGFEYWYLVVEEILRIV